MSKKVSNKYKKTNSNQSKKITSNNFEKTTSDKSKKITSRKFQTITIIVIVVLALVAAPFIFNSRKSDYQKALETGTTTAAGESASDTTTGTGTNTTVQETNSEKETDTIASSGSDAASVAETTAQAVDPATQQIIEVIASGGYSPREIKAKADVPTILIMKSEGAYGCERAFYIPDLNISEILSENGQAQFDLGTHAKGTKLVGVCGMGMYYFQIFFN